MSADEIPPEGDEVLAAELAFGLLDRDDRLVAERRAEVDARFASACRRWEARATGLCEGVSEVPSESIWLAIRSRLPANDEPRGYRVGPLRWWQAGTGVATACAAVLGIMWLERPLPLPPLPVATQPAPPLVAVLRGKKDAVVAISFDRTTHRLTATPSSLDVSPHAAELWVIPSDGKPRSLGVLAATGSTSRLAAERVGRLIQAGSTLAVSIEPPGGSPTGSPTGEVILTGKVEVG